MVSSATLAPHMKLVFLDIDGVLNSDGWLVGKGTVPGIKLIDPAATARLQRLCEETGAEIVVSSSWRAICPRHTLAEIFEARGLTTRVVGVTPIIPNRRGRGEEIQRWLDTVPATRSWSIDGIVIFDDEEDMLHLETWLVRTDAATGLTDAHVDAAKGILVRPAPGASVGSTS